MGINYIVNYLLKTFLFFVIIPFIKNTQKEYIMGSHNHNHHGHNHDHKNLPRSKLIKALILIASYMVIEFLGGLFTKSLALISDAMHMMTDSLGLVLAIMAITIAKKSSDKLRTYGYERFEILASIVNSLVLFIVAIYILYESIVRLFFHPEINSTIMILIAIIGLLVNIGSLFILSSHKEEDLNMKGAYLEVWADMLGSIGVIIGAILIKITGIQYIDSIIAILIGFMVFPRAYSLLKEGVNIILQGVPSGVCYDAVYKVIQSQLGVISCHDLHIWSVTQNKIIITGHIVYDGKHSPENVRQSIEEKLISNFNLKHSTFQMEKNNPDDHAHI